MPVRYSVCTDSLGATSRPSYSLPSSNYSASSLPIGRYKPLRSNNTLSSTISPSYRTSTSSSSYRISTPSSSLLINSLISSRTNSGADLSLNSLSLTSSSPRYVSSRFERGYSSPIANSTSSIPKGVPRGLHNLGNTCYMNAALQALYAIDRFKNMVSDKCTSSRTLTKELGDLFEQMHDSTEAVSPARLRLVFSRGRRASFSGASQQDAQEFLKYLINGLHEEWNQAGRAASSHPRSATCSHRVSPTSSREAWSQYRELVDDSPMLDLLVGQLCSTVSCSVCQRNSYCWDPFWDISLPLPPASRRSLYASRQMNLADLLAEFTAAETLDTDERPICENCKTATRSSKQISFSRLPQLLILHLKKFTNDGYKLQAPEIRVEPELSLQLNDSNGPSSTSSHRRSYRLKACISHQGYSASSGHYTCHCYQASKWLHYNDSQVRDVTSSFDSTTCLPDAYVLFYVAE